MRAMYINGATFATIKREDRFAWCLKPGDPGDPTDLGHLLEIPLTLKNDAPELGVEEISHAIRVRHALRWCKSVEESFLEGPDVDPKRETVPKVFLMTAIEKIRNLCEN